MVRRRPLPGTHRTVPDIRERATDAVRGFRCQDPRVLGFYSNLNENKNIYACIDAVLNKLFINYHTRSILALVYYQIIVHNCCQCIYFLCSKFIIVIIFVFNF